MEERMERLRVLISNEREDRIERIASVVRSLGHEVVLASTDVTAVGALTAETLPDVALVALGEDSEHALALIERIVREAACPVIALLVGQDAAFVDAASRRGVFAYVSEAAAPELGSALAIVLRRFAEYQNLEGAFARRAITERAKGILMERYQIDEVAAFNRLRTHARASGRRLVEVAQAMCDSHGILSARPEAPPPAEAG
jgi:AmiR/NasT family two-component response regulator